MPAKLPGADAHAAQAERDARRAAALRENLKRRKAQARGEEALSIEAANGEGAAD